MTQELKPGSWMRKSKQAWTESLFLGKWDLNHSNPWIIRALSFSRGSVKKQVCLHVPTFRQCKWALYSTSCMSNTDYNCLRVRYMCEIDTRNLTCEARRPAQRYFQDEKTSPALCITSDLLRSHACPICMKQNPQRDRLSLTWGIS